MTVWGNSDQNKNNPALLLNGTALAAIAIFRERARQAYGKRLQQHSEAIHG